MSYNTACVLVCLSIALSPCSGGVCIRAVQEGPVWPLVSGGGSSLVCSSVLVTSVEVQNSGPTMYMPAFPSPAVIVTLATYHASRVYCGDVADL